MLKKLLILGLILLLLSPALAEPTPTTPPADGQQTTDENGPSGEVIGYILVTTASGYGWLPVPEKGEYAYPLEQAFTDGTLALNVIHVSAQGIYMESSTCENQDCVEQGTVTFDNLQDRILGRFIICLPNAVTLELYTVEEVEALLAAQEETPDAQP